MVGKNKNTDSELETLRKNNLNLATLLANEKRANQILIEEKNIYQKKLHTTTISNMRYHNVLDNMLCQTKQLFSRMLGVSENINALVRLTEEATQLLTNKAIDDVEQGGTCLNNLQKRPISPNAANKTHAVKPMVSGHVILRPIINLRRLSNIRQGDIHLSTEEINHVSESSHTEENASQVNVQEETSNEQQNNFRVFANGQPIRAIDFPEVFDIALDHDVTSPNGFETNEQENLVPVVQLEVLQHLQRELSVILEESNSCENSETVENEAKNELPVNTDVTRNAVAQTNGQDNHKFTSSGSLPSTSLDYDPLEGSSAMYLYNRSYRTRIPHYQIYPSGSDTDDTDDWNAKYKKVKKRVNKKKKKPVVLLKQLPSDVSNEDKSNEVAGAESKNNNLSESKKSKRKKLEKENLHSNLKESTKSGTCSSDSENYDANVQKRKKKSIFKELDQKEAVVVLKKLLPRTEENNLENNDESDGRPKRNKKTGNLKEPSLRCKLRRDK